MTSRLVGIAVNMWRDLDGYAVGNGLGELELLPLRRFVNFVWWWVTKEADEEGKTKFESRLWQPPKGVVATEGPWSAEAESKGFAGLRNSLGGGAKKTQQTP